MMRTGMALLMMFSLMALCTGTACAAGGLVTLRSQHGVTETMDRLQAVVQEKGLTVFARIDHGKAAAGVSMELRPTELLIFGNPRVGTLLMQSRQSVGLDLPLKVLVWQDEKGAVWLAYDDPASIAERHGIHDRAELVARMQGALKRFAAYATGEGPAPPRE